MSTPQQRFNSLAHSSHPSSHATTTPRPSLKTPSRLVAATAASLCCLAIASGEAPAFAEAAGQAPSSQAPQAERRVDPRCPANFDFDNLCPSTALKKGLINLARSADMSSCDKLDQCDKCLSGPEWEQKLRDLGLGTSERAGVRPWVLFRNWLSHEVTSTIAMILLREAAGYDARGKSGTNTGNMDMICCGEEMMVDFERWGEGSPAVRLKEDGYFTVQMLPTGYIGTGALYVPSYTLDEYPLADAYNAYRYLPEYSDIFPKAFSTNCTDMVLYRNPANLTKCGTSEEASLAFVCSKETWATTACKGDRKAHWVPPQCEGESAKHCQEVYHPDPTTDRGRFEGQILNNNLNFTMAYIGYNHFSPFLKAKYARKEHFIFVGQVPDPLTAALRGNPLSLKPNTAACESLRTLDPDTNLAGCAYPVTAIQKAARRDVLAAHPDFKFFVDNFNMNDELISSLLLQHSEGTGAMNVHEVSCSWIKSNVNVWSRWIQHTPKDGARLGDGLASDSGVAAYVVAVPIVVVVVVLVAVLALFMVFCRPKAVDNSHAPKKGPLALLFTDVERSTTLYELCGDDMRQAMDTHNSIIRRLIDEYQAYEVKTNGDSFMIACWSLTDATLLALAIQTALNEASYPPSIAQTYSQILGSRGDAESAKRSSSVPDGVATSQSDNDGTTTAAQQRERTSRSVTAYSIAGSAHQQQLQPSLSAAPASTFDIWNGLRVRIALHWAHEVTPQVDPRTGRYDYFGHDINVCARVESYAVGGQILVDESTHMHMTRNDDLMELVGSDCTMTLVARAAELKGVQDKVALWSILPISLAKRRFAPLLGVGSPFAEKADKMKTDAEMVLLGDNEDGDHSDSADNQQPRQRGAMADIQAAVRFAVQYVVGAVAGADDRQKLVVAVAENNHLPTHHNAGRLLKLVQSSAAHAYVAKHQPALLLNPAAATASHHGTTSSNGASAVPSSKCPASSIKKQHVRTQSSDHNSDAAEYTTGTSSHHLHAVEVISFQGGARSDASDNGGDYAIRME